MRAKKLAIFLSRLITDSRAEVAEGLFHCSNLIFQTLETIEGNGLVDNNCP